MAREGNADRFDLVNRGVRGVKLPRQIIKRHLAIPHREGLLLLSHRSISKYGWCGRLTMINPSLHEVRRAGFSPLWSLDISKPLPDALRYIAGSMADGTLH